MWFSFLNDEWMFPGNQYLDGTIEGAMKAGLEAYPVNPSVKLDG